MLAGAGVAFEARSADIDERALEASLGDAPPHETALALARAKALAVKDAARPVLGSDSLVAVNGRRFDKPASRDDAAEHLRFFSGKTMHLHSAAAIAKGGAVTWSHAAQAKLHVRHLSEAFIQHYLEAEWPEVGYCVGVFRIEAMGVQLFENIEGNYFTILGMPLLPVLGALRGMGEMPS